MTGSEDRYNEWADAEKSPLWGDRQVSCLLYTVWYVLLAGSPQGP